MSLKLSNERARHLISEIIAGQRVVEVRNERGDLDLMVFKIPRHSTKLLADLQYNRILKRAMDEGIQTRAQMERMIVENGLVDFERLAAQELELNEREKRTQLLLDNCNHPKQRKKLRVDLRAIQLGLSRIKSEREKPFQNTAENKAEQHRTLFLVVQGIFDLHGNQKWKSVEDFNNDRRYELHNEAIINYIDYAGGHDTPTIRALARHPEWSIYWRSAKSTGCPVFESAVTEWDINKLLLVHWSQFYEDISRAPEPPPDYVIEDDYQLDKWLKDKRIVQDRNSRVAVRTDGEGRVTTTYNVSQPFTLVTAKEAALLKKEKEEKVNA